MAYHMSCDIWHGIVGHAIIYCMICELWDGIVYSMLVMMDMPRGRWYDSWYLRYGIG
jgi:hypothetical protein